MKKILILFFIFLFAFSIRLNWIINDKDGLEGDEKEYDRLAMSIVNQKGYVTASGVLTSHRPPLYAGMLALIYSIFGHNIFIVKIIQAFAGSLTVCLLYLISYREFDGISAFLVGLFSSFYMLFVYCTKLLLTETFFMLLLVFIVFLIVSKDKPGVLRFSILGFLCGFLTLTRSTGFLFPFLIIIFYFIKLRRCKVPSKTMVSQVLILMLCFLMVLAPWTIRNYRVHNRLILISTNSGLNLYQGVISSPGTIFDLDENSEIAKKAKNIPNEADRNDFFIKEALSVYKNYPLFALKMLLMRFLSFWSFIDWEIIGGDVLNYQFIFLLPFMFLGMVSYFQQKKEVPFLLLVILYFLSFVLFFPGTSRYRMPIDGFIIIFGVCGIHEFITKKKKKIYPLLIVTVYFLLTYALYINSFSVKILIVTVMKKIGLW